MSHIPPSPRPPHTPSGQQGAAIIMVLSMLVIISLLVVGFAVVSSLESRNARNFLKNTQSDFLSHMAVSEALLKIRSGTPKVGTNFYWVSGPGRIWRVAGSDVTGATNRLSFSNYAQRTSGYINLFSETLTNAGGQIVGTYGLPAANTNMGFGFTNSSGAATTDFVNLNSIVRGAKICPDPDPALTGASANYIPLVVSWVNVTRDGTKPPGTNNPIIGRYAYWVDVENARLNVNDLGATNRQGWHGLSPREIEVEGILEGMDSGTLSTLRGFRDENGTNKFFFRRNEDLRAAGISPSTLRANSFYLTSVGRNDEVDNAGRIPISVDLYNGSTNATFANIALHLSNSGVAPRNHPMAQWDHPTNMPYLSGRLYDIPSASGSGSVGPQNGPFYEYPVTDTSTWDDRLNNPGGANNPFLPDGTTPTYANITIYPPWSYSLPPSFPPTGSGLNEDGYLVEYSENTWVMSAGSVNLPSPNYDPMGTNTAVVSGTDWLPRRLTDHNRSASDTDYHHDLAYYQRLMQSSSPRWFAYNPAGTGTGKYTWNQLGQIFANINTWRMSNTYVLAQGDYNWGTTTWPDHPINKLLITNMITKANAFGENSAETINITRGGITYPVAYNQNLGNKGLPYVNEIGFSITRSGASLSHITLHVELWNPAYKYQAMSNATPYNLAIVAVMPEAAYGTSSTFPDHYSNGPPSSLTYNQVDGNIDEGVTGNGPAVNPERFGTRWGRQIPATTQAPADQPGLGTWFYPALGFYGSIWASPGVNNLSVNGLSYAASFSTPYGGGLVGNDHNWFVAHASKFQNRWHAPVKNQDWGMDGWANRVGSVVAILKDAHLIDWRVPQHVDIALLPRCWYENGGINIYSGWGHGSGIVINDAVSPNINLAVAVGLSAMPTNGPLADIQNTSIPSMAAGLRPNNEANNRIVSPFYNIVPHPRINPDDSDTNAFGYGVHNGTENTGIPQLKFLPFLEIPTIDGTITVSREVIDPRVNGRTAFVDFTKQGASEYDNLINTYDDNDWGPKVISAGAGGSSAASLNIVNTAYNSYGAGYSSGYFGGIYGAHWGAAGLFEKSTFNGAADEVYEASAPYAQGGNLTGVMTRGGSEWGPGEVGAVNRLTDYTVDSAFMNQTTWSTPSTPSSNPFLGYGDGDGDLTSHLIKEDSFEHPAEMGYIHTGIPWRTLRFRAAATNGVDEINPPDWAFFDLFQGMSTNGPDKITPTIAFGSLRSNGTVRNPRRGNLTLNPRIYTAASDQTTGLPATQSRLKPYLALLTNVISDSHVDDVAKALHTPSSSSISNYTPYTAGTLDRFGIPGVLDSAGEICEVIGRFDGEVRVTTSSPYTRMVTNTIGAYDTDLSDGPIVNSITGPLRDSAPVSSRAMATITKGWAGAEWDSSKSAVTLSMTNSAGPKEVLRAIGAFMSPRTDYFRIYVLTQTIEDKDGVLTGSDRVTNEKWKEVLVERVNNYSESTATGIRYRIVSENNL